MSIIVTSLVAMIAFLTIQRVRGRRQKVVVKAREAGTDPARSAARRSD